MRPRRLCMALEWPRDARTPTMNSGIHRARPADPGDGFGDSYPISLMDPGIHRSHPPTFAKDFCISPPDHSDGTPPGLTRTVEGSPSGHMERR
jgi:hypothetical protein